MERGAARRLRSTVPVALIHRRNTFQSGATKALIELLSAWPTP
jgi:hypothetical protein